MPPIRVAVMGLDRQGRYLADLVRTQSDFSLSGTHDTRPEHLEAASRMGLPISENLQKLLDECEVAVHLGIARVPFEERAEVSRSILLGARTPPPGSSTISVFHAPSPRAQLVQLPGAQALAFARLLGALAPFGPMTRFFASTFCRAGHGTQGSAGPVDALEPIFDDVAATSDLEALFQGGGPVHHVRRVRGPGTHSDVHMLKIDFEKAIEPPGILDGLRRAPRLRVGAARDGFTTTAHVQEFYRDLGGIRPDRYEVFIWEESVQVDAGSLMLMVDVCPDATPVPELFDAIRHCGSPELLLPEVVARTDRGLGLPRLWQDSGVVRKS